MHELGSYRPISLTFCLGKLIEKTVHRRLSWTSDSSSILPEAMSCFRQQRCTEDSLADLVSSLEKACATRQTAHVVFIDIHLAFDTLPHEVIIDLWSYSAISSSFLRSRTMTVNVHGCLGTSRNLTQGVSRGSVVSPLMFNFALASLPAPFLQPIDATVHFALSADDTALWYVGPTIRRSAVRTALHAWCRLNCSLCEQNGPYGVSFRECFSFLLSFQTLTAATVHLRELLCTGSTGLLIAIVLPVG